jgi:hypothetical protein
MRFGAIAAGVVLLAISGMCGALRERPAGVIQIDFARDSDLFLGLEVEIDGVVVGKLKRTGEQALAGFGVGYGRHEVRLLHPAIGCRPAVVDVEHQGQRIRLLLEIGDWGDGTEFFFDY